MRPVAVGKKRHSDGVIRPDTLNDFVRSELDDEGLRVEAAIED